jgi:hypothetical protein
MTELKRDRRTPKDGVSQKRQKLLFATIALALVLAVGIPLLFIGVASANRDRYETASKEVDAKNEKIFEEGVLKLSPYGVQLTNDEYESVFYDAETIVKDVEGKPTAISIAESGNEGEDFYLLLNGVATVEVEKPKLAVIAN